MKLLVEHEMEHADAENDGMSDKISASSSSVAGWWVIYDVEMRHLYHRHDSGFLPCQRAYNKQQLCGKWTFCYNMGWSTVMQKNRGYFRRKTPFFVYFWQILRFSARDIAYVDAADVSVLLPHFNISTPPWHGQVWGLNSYIWRSMVAAFFFQKKKTYPKNGDPFF